MSPLLVVSLAAVFGYLLGCLPFAVIVSKVFGLADPRSFGSGNPGATNVLRTGNTLAALLTLLGDAAKGLVAMLVVEKVGAGGTAFAVPAAYLNTAVAVAGLAAFVGHVFPVTLGFKGGKGVATALGVLLGFSSLLGGLVAAIWIGTAAAFRYSSLAALVAAASAPFVAGWIVGRGDAVLPISIMSVVLIARHKSNIRNLLAGSETRIGKKKPAQES